MPNSHRSAICAAQFLRALLVTLVLFTSTGATAQEIRFQEALKHKGNCVVAEAIGIHSDSDIVTVLEIRCDGAAFLWRRSISRFSQGIVRGEFVGVPLALAINSDDLTAYLKLPPQVGVRSTSLHGTKLRLAVRKEPTDNFVVVQLLSLDEDMRNAPVNKSSAQVTTFTSTWDQVWYPIHWNPIRFN